MKENNQIGMKWGFHYNQMRKRKVSNGAHTHIHGLIVDGERMKMEIVCGIYALQNLISSITENNFLLSSWEEFPGPLYSATSKR
jgi:hypothetical protein